MTTPKERDYKKTDNVECRVFLVIVFINFDIEKVIETQEKKDRQGDIRESDPSLE